VWQLRAVHGELSIGINSVLIERITSAMGAAVFIIIIFLFPSQNEFPIWCLAFSAIVAFISVLASIILVYSVNIETHISYVFLVPIKDFALDYRKFIGSVSTFLVSMFILLIGQLLVALMIFLLTLEWHQLLSFTECVILGSMVILVGMVPISVASWGVCEVLLVAMISSLGGDGALALQLSIVVGVLHLIAAVPGGIIRGFSRRA